MQAAIQKGKDEFETTLVLDINEDNPQAVLEPRAQRLADDLRAQGLRRNGDHVCGRQHRPQGLDAQYHGRHRPGRHGRRSR